MPWMSLKVGIIACQNPQEGVNADAISREDLLNAPGEVYSVKLTTPGEYGYGCEPHAGE